MRWNRFAVVAALMATRCSASDAASASAHLEDGGRGDGVSGDGPTTAPADTAEDATLEASDADDAPHEAAPSVDAHGVIDAATTKHDAGAADDATGTPSDGGSGDPLSLDGGALASLAFGIVGDTRPATVNDTTPSDDPTTGYPSEIIAKAFAALEASPAAPAFVVGAGDYGMATKAAPGAAQHALYLAARAKFSGAFYPTMGNHECNNGTSGNCAGGTTTAVFTDYLSTFLEKPLGIRSPYYAVRLRSSTPGAWTAKLVFVAANAWDAAQASWLEATLGEPTTYTFVVRHEPTVTRGTPAADISPGGPASDAIVLAHPFTLLITGHAHHHSVNEVPASLAKNPPPTPQIIIGNGGAPLDLPSHPGYGYGQVEQLPSGHLRVEAYTFATVADTPSPDPKFCFEVAPAGGAVAPCR